MADESRPVAEDTDRSVSVIIVSYNCWPVLDACLRSVARDPAVGQVVVVDNASEDEGLVLLPAEHPSVELISLDYNSGFSHACNVGLERARSDVVLFLNPDTELLADSPLAGLVRLLQEDPSVGMIGPKLVQRSGELDHACVRGEPTLTRSVSYQLGLHRVFPTSPTFAGYVAGHLSKDEAQDVEVINGAFMMVRRSEILRLGGFDERYWMYAEDIDLCRRYREAVWRVRYEPGVQVIHIKGGTDGGSRSPRARSAFYTSMAIYYRRWYPSMWRHPLARCVAALVGGYGWMIGRRSS